MRRRATPSFHATKPSFKPPERLLTLFAKEFGVVGVNGVDFIARDGVPYAIEVNPRWAGSMELVERAYGLSGFGVHAAACACGTLPKFDFAKARRGVGALGKAIVFARRDVTAGDTHALIADASVRDVPPPGTRVPAGRPMCTVFATGHDSGPRVTRHLSDARSACARNSPLRGRRATSAPRPVPSC